MRKDPTQFRERFKAWKAGEKVYENGLPKYDNGKGVIYREDNIPFIPEKQVKLTNAGLATGAILSTNVLDSIADAAIRQGLDINTAIGLATKESTLGNPTDDRSVYTLLNPTKAAIFKKLGTGQHINKYEDNVNSRQLVNYYKDLAEAGVGDDESHNATTNESVLDAAFRLYKNTPQKYNPGQKNYQQLVDKRVAEISRSPEVMQWRRTYDAKKEYQNSRWNRQNPLLNKSKFNLPKFAMGTEGDDDMNVAASGAYIGGIPFILMENDRNTANNKQTDAQIAKKSLYGWDNNIRSVFLNSSTWLKNNVNPAWNIIDAQALKIPFGTQDMSGATEDDNAFFLRHLGYPRNLKSMPITGIRFAGDYNDDGTQRLPYAEYTGLSKTAKDFIREGIKLGKIKPKNDGQWTKIEEGRRGWSKYTSHLGTYSIRENNGSGIYDVYDTYDFPWYNPILNRKNGKQIEVRDTIHGQNANPSHYNFKFSKKR